MFKFGPYLLDPAVVRLTKNGVEIELEPQVFNTLLLLIENRERVVTKDELFEKIWHGRHVTDHVITRIIYELRKILDEKDDAVSHIRTVRGKGYQFIASLSVAQSNETFVEEVSSTQSPLVNSKLLLGILAVIVLVLISFFFINQNRIKPQTPKLSKLSNTENVLNIYPVISVLPIEVAPGNEELSMLIQSLIDYLTNQLAVNLNMKVIHPDSLVSMSDQLDDVWAIQKATHSDFIIQGFVESVTEQTVNLHLSLYKNNQDGTLTPFKLGAFKFPYPNNIKELNSLYKERKVTVKNIIKIIKPGVVVKDNGDSETDDPEAYRLVIAAHHMSRNDDCHDLRRAESLLLSAVQRDDKFAYAYYQLFANYFKRVWLCGDSIEYHKKALVMADIVERLAPNVYSPMYKGRNAILIESNQVESAYELSKNADWNDPNALNPKVYGLRYAGFFNLASQNINRILQLDPFFYSQKPINQAPNTLMYQNRYAEYLALLAEPGSSYHDYYRGLSLVLSDNNAEAMIILQAVIDKKSNSMFDKLSQALKYLIESNQAAAIEIVDEIMQNREARNHTDGEMTYKLVQLYALANAKDKALKYFQISVNQGFFPVKLFLIDPALKSIRNTDQFLAIVDQAKLRHEAFANRFDLEVETLVGLNLD